MDINLSQNIILTKTYEISNISISVIDLQLSRSVTLLIALKNINNEPIEHITLVLDGDRYQQWASDDNYIKTVCLQEIERVYKTK